MQLIKIFLNKREVASASLEAALCLPLLVAVFLQCTLMVYASQAEMDYHSAMLRSSKEAGISLSILTAVKDQDLTEPGEADAEKRSAGIDPIQFAIDSGLNLITGPLLGHRLDQWYLDLRSKKTNFEVLQDSRIFLQLPIRERQGRLYAYYRLPGLWESLQRDLSVPIIAWQGRSRDQKPEASEENKADIPDDIWSWDNFSRGKTFQKIYGANLSTFHPVVAKAEEGHVTQIKSMDLTKKTYADTANLAKTLEEHINELSAFSGTEETAIVRSKSILLIVPENSPPIRLETVERILSAAAGKGIQYKIIKTQTSNSID